MILPLIIVVLVGVAYSRMAIRYEKSGLPAGLLGAAVVFGCLLLFRYLFVLMLTKDNGTIEMGALSFAGLLSYIASGLISAILYFQLRNYWQSKLPIGKKKSQ